jgi:hypothetical protein
MPHFQTATGPATVEVGDDLEVTVTDSTIPDGRRVHTGQVTSIRPEQNAIWVRGVRIDLAEAHIVRKIDADAPENLTPTP